MATNACKSRKIKIEDKTVKPSYLVTKGEQIQVYKEGFNLTFEVVELINKRVSATLAQPCYKNLTPQEELDKYKSWYIGKAAAEIREKGSGRPTKRERREIEQYKEETFSWDEFDD